MSTLTFLGNVNNAVDIVKKKYPDVYLGEIDGSTSDQSFTSDPKKIDKLTVIFGNIDPLFTVSITSKDGAWGVWNEPTKKNQMLTEDTVIELPVGLDLPAAYDLMVKAGYDMKFSHVTVRQPVDPRIDEPRYQFTTAAGTIFVGVKSHKVTK